MKTFIHRQPIPLNDPFSLQVFHEAALFYDIETTGFSARHNHIYFIGCGYREGDTLTIKQFFAETPLDEVEVLQAFIDLLHSFAATITFNGLGFDLPFIQERLRQLGITQEFPELSHIDIFRLISPIKKLLKLPNIKQKSIEQFLELHREDTYSGGELINVYHAYVKDHREDQLKVMQLHNKEDVLGMLEILPILSYSEFVNGHFEILNMGVNTYQEFEGSQGEELLFFLHPAVAFPRRISCGKNDIYLSAYKDQAKLRVKIYQGELKYFYSNYKDYYYLPTEDRAIHKSVAFYVDKDFRTKAKAATCYSKKSGRFLPQYGEVFSPYFKLEYNDKISYFEMTDEFQNSKELQKIYGMHLLGILVQ